MVKPYKKLYFPILVCYLLPVISSFGQYFQFSEVQYTPLRINPAMAAASDFAKANLVYRNQSTGTDFSIKSTGISALYPLIQKNGGKRWSGIGFSALDDNSGQAGIFKHQEVGLTYAINIFPDRWQSLSLGFQGLYKSKTISLDGLYTGAQYVPDRGFSGGLVSGEDIEGLKVDFFSYSTGVYWNRFDKSGTDVAYVGLAFFDFNRPNESFFENGSRISPTYVLSAGVLAYEGRAMDVFPKLLFTRSGSFSLVNVGAVWSYELGQQFNGLASGPAKLNLNTSYVVGRYLILGLEIQLNDFSFGISYDTPFVSKNYANQGAFELGLEYRNLIKSKMKSSGRLQRQRLRNRKSRARKSRNKRIVLKDKGNTKRAHKVTPKKMIFEKTEEEPKGVEIIQNQADIQLESIHVNDDGKKSTEDELETSAKAGQVIQEPFEVEKAMLYFKFGFGETELGNETKKYLNGISDLLKEDPSLKVILIGHTDNLGKEDFNQKLSIDRAAAVKAFFVGQRIAPHRVTVQGKGELSPLNNNQTEAERAENRRVEVSIYR